MQTPNFTKLKAHILGLSSSDFFEEAKNEWKLVGVEIHLGLTKCPCGQGIKEICLLKNHVNGNRTYVGNVCVNQFIGISTGSLFSGLNRIQLNADANANEDVINHAYTFGYIYENEFKFLMDTRKKRKLSLGQLAWKKKINWRITSQVKVVNEKSEIV